MSDWIQPTALLYAAWLAPWRGNIAGLWVLSAGFIHPRLSSPFYLKQLRLSPHQSVTQHLLINTSPCLFPARRSFTSLPMFTGCVYKTGPNIAYHWKPLLYCLTIFMYLFMFVIYSSFLKKVRKLLFIKCPGLKLKNTFQRLKLPCDLICLFLTAGFKY